MKGAMQHLCVDISCNWTGRGCGSLDVRFDKDELWLRAAPCRAGRASNSRVGATFACLRRCTDAAQLADGSGRAARGDVGVAGASEEGAAGASAVSGAGVVNCRRVTTGPCRQIATRRGHGLLLDTVIKAGAAEFRGLLRLEIPAVAQAVA